MGDSTPLEGHVDALRFVDVFAEKISAALRPEPTPLIAKRDRWFQRQPCYVFNSSFLLHIAEVVFNWERRLKSFKNSGWTLDMDMIYFDDYFEGDAGTALIDRVNGRTWHPPRLFRTVEQVEQALVALLQELGPWAFVADFVDLTLPWRTEFDGALASVKKFTRSALGFHLLWKSHLAEQAWSPVVRESTGKLLTKAMWAKVPKMLKWVIKTYPSVFSTCGDLGGVLTVLQEVLYNPSLIGLTREDT